MVLLCLISIFVVVSTALKVTAPKDNQVIDITKPFNIKWTWNSSDPSRVSIDVVNATANQEYVLVNNVRGANVSEGNYTLRWADAIPSGDAAYRLVFLNYATGGYVAQSDTFNLTLPSGETRNSSDGNAPASPGTASDTNGASSHGLSSGALAAAIVVPILAVISIAVGVIFLLRRRRRQRSTAEDGEIRKPELEANGKSMVMQKHKSTELTDEKVKHQSAELSGEKDYIKWELPSTPPRGPIDPVEMPAEVPLAEMGTDEHKGTMVPSENGTTVAGSDTGRAVEDKVSPMINQDEFVRDSMQSTRSPVTPVAPAFREEGGASSTTGRSRFQEALYDIISDELRRPGSPNDHQAT